MDAGQTVEYLDLLRDVLRDYRPPSTPFNPSGPWIHQYNLYTVVNASRQTHPTPRPGGSLRIERIPQAAGGATLKVKYEKTSQYAGAHTLLTTLACAGDDLSTPAKWHSTYSAVAPAQPLGLSLQVHETAVASGRTVHIKRGKVQRRFLLQSDYTSNWALFDAVQRLAHVGSAALRFTLFDTGGAPKANQVLAFYQSVDLKDRWPGAPILRVHGFLQIGDGISPQTYWIDDRGELLFLLSGLDAFVLDATRSAYLQISGGRT